MNFCNMTFQPSNQAKSVIIQEKLFEMGYRWSNIQHQVVQYVNENFIHNSESGYITTSHLLDPYDKEHLHYVITEVKFVPANELVEINGNLYSKADVENLIKHLKPIS